MREIVRFLKLQFILIQLFGIPVVLDLRWIPLLVVLWAAVAAKINVLTNDLSMSLVLGFAATLAIFVSIFLHEVANLLAAGSERRDISDIELYPFGGLTHYRREPHSTSSEYKRSVAGITVSFALAATYAALAVASDAAGTDILESFFYSLALVNFLIAIFNIFPGYPLDGGRIFRTYLWSSGKEFGEATLLAARAGTIIGAGLGIIGLVLVVLEDEFFAGVWTLVSGYFLFDTAQTVVRETRRSLRAVVDDVMHLAVPVSPDLTLRRFFDDVMPVARASVFPVSLDHEFYGMLIVADAKGVDRQQWQTTFVRDLMRPVTHDQFVDLGTPMPEADALMRVNKIGAVAVVDADGKLVGFIRRTAGKRNASRKLL